MLYVAGLNFQRALPEVDEINYVTHVKQPTLILNGELDFFFPSETSQRPMFELLGTPAEHKKRLVYPGGHSVPRTEMIKESLDIPCREPTRLIFRLTVRDTSRSPIR